MMWITGGSAIIAFVSMVVAIVACADAKKSRKAAERSATAAETTAQIDSDLYEQGKYKFSLHRTGNLVTQILRNDGTHTAYDVAVTAPGFHTRIPQDGKVTLPRDTPIKITTRIPGGLTDRRLMVHYRESADGELETFTLYV